MSESPTFFIPTGGAWPEMVLRRSDGSQVTVTAAQVEALVRAAYMLVTLVRYPASRVETWQIRNALADAEAGLAPFEVQG